MIFEVAVGITIPVESRAKCVRAYIDVSHGNCGNSVAWLFLPASEHFLPELDLTREILALAQRHEQEFPVVSTWLVQVHSG
jgi:hypothetical protein